MSFRHIIASMALLGLLLIHVADGAVMTRIENEYVEIVLELDSGRFSLIDKRTGHIWKQVVPTVSTVKTLDIISSQPDRLTALIRMANEHAYTFTLALDAHAPELVMTLDGEEMPDSVRYPFPFIPGEADNFLLSFKSGLLIPATDSTLYFDHNRRREYAYYEGHNSSMPFHGLIRPAGDGLMCLVETPNDARFVLQRPDNRLVSQIRWMPEFGRIGYPRQLRYILFDHGGHVAMAHRFRAYAEKQGMIKTLREKQELNPDTDLLIGAGNIWIQDYYNELDTSLSVARDLVDLGMTHMIFNGRSAWWNNMTAEEIEGANALGYLSSRYDVYQDAFDPEFLHLVNKNPSWVQAAWPHDIVVAQDGSFLRGWNITDREGNRHYCGRVTEMNRTRYARERISAELQEKPYRARLIDTEAASAWAEDYHPDRMMTRAQCRAGRMELLRYVFEETGLISGAEGLQCHAVPYVHYFEGVGPLEPFRHKKAPGEHPFKNFEWGFEFDPDFAALLRMAHRYMVPLWDLVFHGCVVAYPRWDEACNKFPHELWVERGILQKILYGRPPLFTIDDPAYWQVKENRELIAGIYHAVHPVARATGYARMMNHEFLTSDRDVQRTTFDNGIVVTVNFGDITYEDETTGVLSPGSHHVVGLPR